jgi:hypothetical protein
VKRKVRVPVSDADLSEDTSSRNAGRMVDLMVDGTDVYVVSLFYSLFADLLCTSLLRLARPRRLVTMSQSCSMNQWLLHRVL